MTKEIILVEVVNGTDLSTDYCKAFTDDIKAENYFRYLVGKFNVTDNEEDVSAFVEDGFCDFTYIDEKMSIITKCIIFEDDIPSIETSMF